MTIQILLFTLVLAPLLWVTARGKDAWPFSSYPMFSRLTNISEVEVFRLALETTTGEIVWWRSEFYRYPEFVGRKLRQLDRMESEGGKAALLAQMERQRYLAAVVGLLELENGLVERYRAFHIVRRTGVVRNDEALEINEQTVTRIPLGGAGRIRRAD